MIIENGRSCNMAGRRQRTRAALFISPLDLGPRISALTRITQRRVRLTIRNACPTPLHGRQPPACSGTACLEGAPPAPATPRDP